MSLVAKTTIKGCWNSVERNQNRGRVGEDGAEQRPNLQPIGCKVERWESLGKAGGSVDGGAPTETGRGRQEKVRGGKRGWLRFGHTELEASVRVDGHAVGYRGWGLKQKPGFQLRWGSSEQRWWLCARLAEHVLKHWNHTEQIIEAPAQTGGGKSHEEPGKLWAWPKLRDVFQGRAEERPKTHQHASTFYCEGAQTTFKILCTHTVCWEQHFNMFLFSM